MLVRPFPGKLERVKGSVPHPKGEIRVALEKSGAGWTARVELPAGVPGEFEWKGKRTPLKPGANVIKTEAR